jgi:RNA polymerase sigma factor (sigma-70 family)
VSRGDSKALETFYLAWFDRVFLAARRVTRRDEAFCLDVVQEVMLKVARKMRAMDTQLELERWMWRVVRTTSADLLKRERRRTAREGRRPVPAPAPQPDALAAAEEESDHAVRWLAELPGADAQLVIQRAVRERTLPQIAADTGLTQGAVHGRVRRAVARLSKATGGEP